MVYLIHRKPRHCTVLVLFFAGLNMAICKLADDIEGDDPCAHPEAIQLPASDKCVVPVESAHNWASAQASCEEAKGKLYQLPIIALQNSYSELMYCLASKPNSTDTNKNYWFNGLAVWSPQFRWVNGSELAPVKYCPRQKPHGSGGVSVESSFLSVDYCVATCHEASATYIVIHHTDGSPKCYCFYLSTPEEKIPCDTTHVSYANTTNYFIVQAHHDAIISVVNSNAPNNTPILCATVDTETHADRLLKSESCFNTRGFVCNLGKKTLCPEEDCDHPQTSCHLKWKGDCLKRDNSPYNWYEAQSLCAKEGGDLWIMDSIHDMLRFNQHITEGIRYWIGATNFRWANDSGTGAITTYRNDARSVRCGQLTLSQRTGVWGWNHSHCGQEQYFLCQFDKGSSKTSTLTEDVECPWPITIRPIGASRDDDPFPLAATISGMVAGLVLLTTLLVGFLYCCRRQWIYTKLKKAREYLAVVPYFADTSFTGQGSGVEFESMSNGPHNMSYMSDHNSQTGLVKGGYPNAYALTTSYRDNSAVYSDRSLDRRNRDSTLQRKLNDSQNFLASQNTSMDDRAFPTTYSTLLAKSKTGDVMTLEGGMKIQDDLDGIRGTLRGKPEVTLVTDHADLNFTVNHAVAQGHPDMSRISLDKTMDEITLPPTEGGMPIPLPERLAEARVISYMSHHEL